MKFIFFTFLMPFLVSHLANAASIECHDADKTPQDVILSIANIENISSADISGRTAELGIFGGTKIEVEVSRQVANNRFDLNLNSVNGSARALLARTNIALIDPYVKGVRTDGSVPVELSAVIPVPGGSKFVGVDCWVDPR